MFAAVIMPEPLVVCFNFSMWHNKQIDGSDSIAMLLALLVKVCAATTIIATATSSGIIIGIRAYVRVDAASANAFYSIIKCAHFNAFYFDDNKMRNKMRNMLF